MYAHHIGSEPAKISLGMMVTCMVWIAHKLVSSISPMIYPHYLLGELVQCKFLIGTCSRHVGMESS